MLGQITFNKIDTFTFVNSTATSVVETDSCYYVSGVYSDIIDSVVVSGSYINKVAFDGTSEKVGLLVDSTGARTFDQYRSNLKISKDNNFFQTGYKIENSSLDPYLIKFDADANILFQTLLPRYFPNANFDLDTDFIELENGDIITLTRCDRDDQEPFPADEICIFKLNSEGEILWQKIIEDPERREKPRQLKRMENGNIMIFGGKNMSHVDFYPQTWATLTEIDTSGNLISKWESEQEDSLSTALSGLIVDDGFLLASSIAVEIFQDRGIINDPMIIKLDMDYKEMWRMPMFNVKDSLFSPGLWYSKLIEIEKNTTFVACGNNHKGVPDSPVGDLSDRFGRLIKFNWKGQLLWERNYQFFGDEIRSDDHEFNDIVLTADGGFLLCGEAFNPQLEVAVHAQNSWLVKLDEWGCLVPGCQDIVSSTDKLDPQFGLKLYPNPTSDVLNVYIDHEQGSSLSLVISNMQGQQMKNIEVGLSKLTMMIDITSFPVGVYFVSLVDNGQILKTDKIQVVR